MNKVDEILDFWFEGLNDTTAIDPKILPAKKWFIKDKGFDAEIREKFGKDLEKARQGEHSDWEETARGRLALVILLDQFSRNIYRGTPEMFATDKMALDLTLRSIGDGKDAELQLIEKVFLYMPLMHAEDLKIQQLSVQSFEKIVEESKQKSLQNTDYFKYNLVYSQKHRDIVKEFGRFPHRNVILGRASTKEESEFLKKPGSSF